MSAWSDIWSYVQLAVAGASGNVQGEVNAVTGNQQVENQAIAAGSAINSFTGGFFGAIQAFITALTDPGMWVSLGWLLLGVILIIAGARMWMGKPATPSVVPIPI